MRPSQSSDGVRIGLDLVGHELVPWGREGSGVGGYWGKLGPKTTLVEAAFEATEFWAKFCIFFLHANFGGRQLKKHKFVMIILCVILWKQCKL